MYKQNKVFSALVGTALMMVGVQASFAANKDIEAGSKIFAQSCQFCHQANAIGKVGFAPSLSNDELLSISSDKFLLSTIRDGRLGTGMPPFSYLGKTKIKQVVSYLRSNSTVPNRSKEVDAQPKAKGSVKSGAYLFETICSTCHGKNGDGYIAGGTGTAIGTKGFVSKASDGFIRETIKYGRSGTMMRGFSGSHGLANLNNQEIDDVIVYLHALAK